MNIHATGFRSSYEQELREKWKAARARLNPPLRKPVPIPVIKEETQSTAKFIPVWASSAMPVVPYELKYQQPVRRLTLSDIIEVVRAHYGISRNDILSNRRTANVVKPRQIAMYLARRQTQLSYPQIGRKFGGRDHTTVLHAVGKIENLRTQDIQLDAELRALEAVIAPCG